MPTEKSTVSSWLEAGSDSRLTLLENGLSKYRIANYPRDTIPFGSCTATNPGTRCFAAAERLLTTWGQNPNYEATAKALRDELTHTFELPKSSTMVTAPSGTDAVYLLNAILAGAHSEVHHIVVGASELGSGTLKVAACSPFTNTTPFQPGLESGVPELQERFSAEPVYLRSEGGVRRKQPDIDAEVATRIQAAQSAGKHVVVHLVAHSKTGLRAPSVSLAKQFPSVTFLVDAAQGRLAPHDIRYALSLGFPVLFTGSKFYSGPPFSGALFLPEPLAVDPGPLPKSLSHWFAKTDLPVSWTTARSSLTHSANPGLLVRWTMAMCEISAYHSIEPRGRAGVYHTFAGAVFGVLALNKHLELDLPIPPVHQLVTALGAYPSVFGFQIIDEDGPLNCAALKKLHAHLDTPYEEHPICFHLGQPVALGPPQSDAQGLLRVALGARLVTQLASEPDAGLSWFAEHFSALEQKISWLLRQGVHR